MNEQQKNQYRDQSMQPRSGNESQLPSQINQSIKSIQKSQQKSQIDQSLQKYIKHPEFQSVQKSQLYSIKQSQQQSIKQSQQNSARQGGDQSLQPSLNQSQKGDQSLQPFLHQSQSQPQFGGEVESYGRFINQLQQEEKRDKKQKELEQRLGQYAESNIELSKGEFIYMMEKFKEDVLRELALKESGSSDSTYFLQQYLHRNGTVLQPYHAQDGGQDYNVRLTPDQLAEMLSIYQQFQESQLNDQKRDQISQELQKKEEAYNKFQQLLNYYYQNDPTQYQQLLDDYNNRVQDNIAENMGMQKNRNGQNKMIQSQKMQSSIFSSSQHTKLSRNHYQIPSQKTIKFQSNSANMDNNVQNEVGLIASRYQKQISNSEFQDLQQQQVVSENLLNFFIRYLQEKQGILEEQSMNSRILYFTTNFYKQLSINSSDPYKINYESASFYTKQYSGKNNTIFDRFDSIIIPIANGQLEIYLIYVNFKNQTITFLDTLLNGYGQKALSTGNSYELTNIPSLLGIIRFLDRESSEKLMKNLELFKYKLKISNHEKVIDPRQSGLQASFLVKLIEQGDTVFSNQQRLSNFHSKLCQLVSLIGVTRNRKNELKQKFNQLPL